jgi:hypothetical protein
MGYDQVQEVNFGGHSPDAYSHNLRAHLWKSVKEWLRKGAIAPADHQIALQLASPGFHLNRRNRFVIESKQSMTARGVASPDRADALCLTFAMPVAPKPRLRLSPRARRGRHRREAGWRRDCGAHLCRLRRVSQLADRSLGRPVVVGSVV